MTALIPTPISRPPATAPDPARTLDTMATVVIVILAVGTLYFAREILVPIAIAILLSFVLAPFVKALRAIGLGKTIAVGLVVCSTFLVAVGVGAILAKQIGDLAADAPRYQVTAGVKVAAIRDFAANNPLLKKLNTTIADVSRATPLAKPPATPKPAEGAARNTGPALKETKPGAPIPVEVVSPAPGVLTILQAAAGTAASPLATAAFVAIFIVFIMMQREDLRNRFIRLVGFGDLQRTTLAMNDAANRLSRYFLAQVLLNTAFGVIVAIALAIIGVPSAILWGIVALFMRFIPYVGSLGSALFPILMAAAAGEGWSMAIETASMFVILELVTGQVVEPLVYGRNTGLSPIAVVVSATFWTWLWGPVGLVLSTPLTVCLLVMGRHVERLSFLDIILGDAPALTPVETFYQRMLAGDPSEIADHADRFLESHTLLDYCDQVAMPALLMAQIDVRRGTLEDERQSRIRDTMRDLVEELAGLEADDPADEKPSEAPAALDEVKGVDDKSPVDDVLPKIAVDDRWRAPASVVCVAGRTPLDEAAAHLLSDLLGRYEIGARVEPADSLMSDKLAELRSNDVKMVVLSFLDADLRIAQARFAVRRLRRRLPGVPIIAAFWMAEVDAARTTGLCDDVRCDTCVSSLPDAIKLCLERAAQRPVAVAA